MEEGHQQKLDGRREVLLGFAKEAQSRGEYFFYVRIPANIGPLERGTQYEDPLQQALLVGDLGEVTGGGSQLGEGTSIAFCGLDVVVRDRNKGLSVILKIMRELGAPPDTVIEEYLPNFYEHPL
jgi:hypothetical protein